MNRLRFAIGLMVLISAVLVYFHSIYWIFFTAFIGLNMMQSSYTGFCPLEKVIG
ncbi:MAG: YgaP family membrane protein [Nanobdellota archaeon]